MKIKFKSLGIFLLLAILLSSCVPRRLDKLKMKKAREDFDKEGLILQDGSFYPDKITEFDVDTYLKWYESLGQAPKLQLSKAQKPKALTKEEMVEDFNYLFNQLKENFPFFEVLKRDRKIDFLGNYDKYLSMVKKSENDEDFIKTISLILEDLNNDHTGLKDRDYVEATLEYFSKNFTSPSIYYEFLNLNRQVVRNRYGLSGIQSQRDTFPLDRRRAIFEKIENPNLEFEKVKEDIGLLRIKKMAGSEKYTEDLKVLRDFLKDKHLYKALVIDIRGNSGGNTEYWKDFLLPKLLTRPKKVRNNLFFKKSNKAKMIFADDRLNVEEISNVDISSLKLDHREDLKNFDLYMKDTISVSPDSSDSLYGYEGSIYLLVDGGVYSAAEGFANFMKHTNSATLIGEESGGDGITLGVINAVMPNSGLVFTYTNTLGYDPLGKINYEDPTSPDIESNSYRDSIMTIEKLMESKTSRP
ncbi:MAG: S41 family peptidase [Anaerococcus sp.]|nr:S41 family peptidase [Anaerococcus sp.]